MTKDVRPKKSNRGCANTPCSAHGVFMITSCWWKWECISKYFIHTNFFLLIIIYCIRWIQIKLFIQHLEVHDDNILTYGMTTCSISSCSSHLFTWFDLLYHVVFFHWILICGSTKHTSVRWLHLPLIDKEVSTAPGINIDAIDNVIGGDKTNVDAIDVDTDTSESEVVWGKRKRHYITTGTSIDMIDGDAINVDTDSSVSEVV
jgi:hypothetical protein